MIVIISPSKKQDFNKTTYQTHTLPTRLEYSQQLIDILKRKSIQALIGLMSISQNLAELNQTRYQNFHTPFTLNNAKQAILAFKGDVYSGIDTAHYNDDDFGFAQQQLRILSGLYGVLKPLDLIQPYRLEMGIKLNTSQGKDLYKFWGSRLSETLNQEEENIVVNLASAEYFKGVDKKVLKAKILQIDFKENKEGQYKIIGIYAKKARGLMVDYMIKNRVTNPELLKQFNGSNYKFNNEFSTQLHWIFTRG